MGGSGRKRNKREEGEERGREGRKRRRIEKGRGIGRKWYEER